MTSSIPNIPVVYGGSKVTDPGLATVMADTTAIADGGLYEFAVILGSSTPSIFEFQLRNAANDATVWSIVLYGGTQSAQYRIPVKVGDGGRVRVMMNATLIGTASAALIPVNVRV